MGQLDSVKLCEIIIYKKIILLKISEIFFFFFIKKIINKRELNMLVLEYIFGG